MPGETFEKGIERLLDAHGLEPEAIREVMVEFKAANPAMASRWDEPKDMDSRGRTLLAVLWLSAKACAIKWMDEKAPDHWARAMLDDTFDDIEFALIEVKPERNEPGGP